MYVCMYVCLYVCMYYMYVYMRTLETVRRNPGFKIQLGSRQPHQQRKLYNDCAVNYHVGILLYNVSQCIYNSFHQLFSFHNTICFLRLTVATKASSAARSLKLRHVDLG